MLKELAGLLGVDKVFYVYLCLKVLDFITGVFSAYLKHEVKSRKMREGLINAAAEIIVIIAIGFADIIFGTNFLMKTTKIAFAIKEILSIVENAKRCGVSVPEEIVEKIKSNFDLTPKGIIEKFPITSISIAVVVVDKGRFANILEIGDTAAQVKHAVKAVMGSSYAIDRRRYKS